MIDPLTRLWNRGGLNELIAKEWAEATRQQRPVTIVMADIDHFKAINDAHGHPGGDAILHEVGRKLLEHARQEDIVGRYGGEEFMIVFTNCDAEKAGVIVERMRATTAAHSFSVSNAPISVTMSFGIASEVPIRGHTSDALLARADAALYRAKNKGRNRVEIA